MTTAVILVTMMVNGLFVGHPMQFQAMTSDCRAEMAVINGINLAHRSTGTEWFAICIGETTGDRAR